MDNSLSDSEKTGLQTKANISPSALKLFDLDNALKNTNQSSLNYLCVNSYGLVNIQNNNLPQNHNKFKSNLLKNNDYMNKM